MDLRRHYLAYLDTLNERRFDDLVEYVADGLTYNDRPMTLQDYRDLLEGDVAAIPDLRFDVGILVVSDDRVACRIDFDCTPVTPFLGFDPPGHSLRFSEHVFYRFSGHRIVEVHSLIDREAIRDQLSPPVSEDD